MKIAKLTAATVAALFASVAFAQQAPAAKKDDKKADVKKEAPAAPAKKDEKKEAAKK